MPFDNPNTTTSMAAAIVGIRRIQQSNIDANVAKIIEKAERIKDGVVVNPTEAAIQNIIWGDADPVHQKMYGDVISAFAEKYFGEGQIVDMFFSTARGMGKRIDSTSPAFSRFSAIAAHAVRDVASRSSRDTSPESMAHASQQVIAQWFGITAGTITATNFADGTPAFQMRFASDTVPSINKMFVMVGSDGNPCRRSFSNMMRAVMESSIPR